MSILTVNVAFSTLIFAPRGSDLRRALSSTGSTVRTVMTPILLLQRFRHLGLMFLAPGAVYHGIPGRFAVQAAYGDLLAAVLALLALWAVRRGSRHGRILVWIFNIEGTLRFPQRDLPLQRHPRRPYLGRPTGFRPSGSHCCWSPTT
jgi:hypothetical protein